MPQAACVGKTTIHVVNPLFAVHCDIDIEMGLLEIRQIIVLRIKSKKHE
jgi:hypothetical protein